MMTRNMNDGLGEEKKSVFVLQSERRKRKKGKRTFSPPLVVAFALCPFVFFFPFYLLNPLPPPREVSTSVAFFFLRGTEPWEGFIAL